MPRTFRRQPSGLSESWEGSRYLHPRTETHPSVHGRQTGTRNRNKWSGSNTFIPVRGKETPPSPCDRHLPRGQPRDPDLFGAWACLRLKGPGLPAPFDFGRARAIPGSSVPATHGSPDPSERRGDHAGLSGPLHSYLWVERAQARTWQAPSGLHFCCRTLRCTLF
jgi:hypothetical protein